MTVKKSHNAIVALSLFLFLCTVSTIIFGILAILPGHLDEFLLTNDDDFCYNPTVLLENRKPPIQVDYGEYKPKMNQKQQDSKKGQNRDKKLQQRVINSILRRLLSSHLWEQSTEDDNDDSTEEKSCSIHNGDVQQTIQSDGKNSELGWENSIGENVQSRNVHPMCQRYRQLRSRLRFQQMLLPWNWYYRNHIRVKGLTLHALADDVSFVSRKVNLQSSWWRMFGWGNNAARIDVVPTKQADLPPAMEIETLDMSFQSWINPIVSAHMNDVVINVVIQKKEWLGGFPLPLQLNGNNGDPRKVVNSTALLIGDMTIPEVLEIMPKPPELEGLYPRIGIVNVTNVTLYVYENKDGNGGPPLKLLLKMRVPDQFFLPITNMTLAHKETGIDRKHFQPMMESSLSDALRGHLVREATAAFRNSWVSAHKAQEQLQHIVQLYLDRWIEQGVQAWHQTQENVFKGVANTTGPIIRAVEDWVLDLKEIVSEPVTPLAVVVSHYWNRTMEGINKHGISIDKQVWGHFNDLVVSKVNNFKREKKISKHLSEFRDAFDSFIAKSGQDIELLVKSCELEVKEIWLAWHRQFWLQL